MSQASGPIDYRSLLKRAYLSLDKMQARLDAVEREKSEPIAIIGLGCRFPGGADSPEKYWRLLIDGKDAITEVSPERWNADLYYDPNPGVRGKMYTRWGGFLERVDEFDAPFFGISPREAVCMDPQQRLVLEVSWEALEHAGQAPDQLLGSRTGVFVGISHNEYAHLFADASQIDVYTSTGNALSVAAGRVSYILGLQGPSIAVDTACSSSLVAVHLAFQSLRSRECDMALAGGVNLLLSPLSTIAVSELRMMAFDGRCKTFDASADGFVRAEGCGMVLLKRLSDAVAHGDRILALIRGSAVNQDGRSGGLTAPNGPAQEAVIRQALASGVVEPADVTYVETHGTGTALGDPIEVQALASVLCGGRDNHQSLAIGSVKTNIGHLEAAAGVAGLIKAVLALQHAEIPPHLHLKTPTPHVRWSEIPVTIPTERTRWQPGNGRRMAGVSSFGFSGTNAHAVLEEAPARERVAAEGERPVHLLALSARTEGALRELARQYARHLAAERTESLADIAFTANTGRSHFEHRLAVIAQTCEEAAVKLAAVGGGDGRSGVFLGRVRSGSERQPPLTFPESGLPADSLERSAWEPMLERVAQQYVEGAEVDWSGFDREYPRYRVALPTYPFERKRYWMEGAKSEPGEAEKHPATKSFADWLYDVKWQPRAGALDSSPADFFPSVSLIAEHLRSRQEPLKIEHGLERYKELIPELDDLSVAYAAQALESLGWHMRPGWSVSSAVLAQELGVATQHRRLLERILEMLREGGFLTSEAGEWLVLETPRHCDFEARWSSLAHRFPAFSAELEILQQCGPHLAAVLSGKRSAIEVLFPGGSLARLEKLYQDSPASRVCNIQIREAIAQALERLPQGRRARLLEIGAGSGGTTAAVLPALRSDAVEYVFTDVSPHFTAKAESKFREYRFLQYRLLDIERDPRAQGFASHQFDVILAANVLHATCDLRRTLAHVRSLLAPDGLLVLLEGTGPQRWLDLIYGLTDGWWKFSDREIRPSHPLLSQDKWMALLGETGFSSPVSVPDVQENEPGLSQPALILARGPDSVECRRAESARAAGEPGGQWLLLADRGGVADRLADVLRLRGERCVLVSEGESAHATADFRLLLEKVMEDSPCRGVVHLWSLNLPELEEVTPASLEAAQVRACGSVLQMVQAITAARIPAPPKLWLITRGAQPVGPDGPSLNAAQSAVWGLGRVVALEHPELCGGLVDLDPGSSQEQAAENLVAQMLESDEEDQVAFRGARRFVPRLEPDTKGISEVATVSLRPDRSYLITGGLGALGLEVARWMVDQGARHLVLTGRSALPDRSAWKNLTQGHDCSEKIASILALEERGASVRVVQADVSDMDRMSLLFERFGSVEPQLAGIIHAAAAITGRTVLELDLDTLRDALRPKVTGTCVLHRLTQERDLDFFVLFSSTTSLWGSKYLAHYAAANQFLDSFAHYRRARKLPALTINWGLWERSGRARSAEDATFRQFGLDAMSRHHALALLGHLLGTDEIQKTVAAVDWSTLKPVYEARRRRPFLEHIQTSPRRPDRFASGPSDFVLGLEKVPQGARRRLLIEHIQAEVGRVLGFDASHLPDPQQGFFEMGMDSLTSVELKSRLETSLGRVLPTTAAFEHPTIEALAGYIEREVLTFAHPLDHPSDLDGALPAPADSPELNELSKDKLLELLAGELASIEAGKAY